MNKQELMQLVSGARGATPVCCPARLKGCGPVSKRELAYCPFPTDDAATLFKVFRATPKFAKIDAHEVLRRAQHGIRAILISESAYDARQAALYLAAMSSHLERDIPANTDDADGIDCKAVVSRIRHMRGKSFDELGLYDLISYAAQTAQNGTITAADLAYQPYSPGKSGKSAMDELNAMTGLDNVKTTLRRQIAVSVLKARLEKGSAACRNLAFAGSPGTGKSVTARLVAEILREEGCGTGRFVEAGREQLVGKYVGHTSPKIAKLFEEARGGVLFIDEAGALIPDRSDSYAEEAINALVRHMELEPETVVIFATYSKEMKELLDSNPSLSSRVARVLEFEDYARGASPSQLRPRRPCGICGSGISS